MMGINKLAIFFFATTLSLAIIPLLVPIPTLENQYFFTVSALPPGPLTHAIQAWDLRSTSKGSYGKCVANLRGQSKDPNLKYFNIPMLPGVSPTLNPKYLVVGLQAGAKTITLAIRRGDFYVMGYSDKVGDNERAHFFQDASADAEKDNLFPNAKGKEYRLIMSYKSSYQDIESKAGVKDRKDFKLGVQKLATWVDKVYGKAVTEKDFVKSQAEMLLMAVQMVCEATRFTYIKNQVKKNWGDVEFTPDYKFIRLQNRWGKLSTAIRGADPTTKKLKSKVDLVHPNGKAYVVDNVNQVRGDIALLSYVK